MLPEFITVMLFGESTAEKAANIEPEFLTMAVSFRVAIAVPPVALIVPPLVTSTRPMA